MDNLIFWLEFISFKNGDIIPMRSIDEIGINTFGSGMYSTIALGEEATVNLVEFESRESRAQFIRKHKIKKYDIKNSVNVNIISKWDKPTHMDIVYFINEETVSDWLLKQNNIKLVG